jgi:hypothetical protein
MRAAFIKDGQVANIVVYADGAPLPAGYVALAPGQAVNTGDGYAGGVFTPAVVATPRVISSLAFMRRLTSAEIAAIEAHPVPDVRRLLVEATAAVEIDLADPVTIGGVQTLEALGVITSGRAAQVLS